MQAFQRSASISEVRSEPIEELRMSGQGTVLPELIRRLHEAPAKMILPHAIHDAAPRQRIAFVVDPMCQRGTSFAFVRSGGQLETRGYKLQRRQRTWSNFPSR